MELTKQIITYVIALYMLIVILFLIAFSFFYLQARLKNRRKKCKIYKYKGYKLQLMRNTLGVKRASYWLFKKDFREIIDQENKALGFEYIKPFDFTKIREQNVLKTDLFGALVLLGERKEFLPQIFSLFVERNDVKYDLDSINFDFEKDYKILSGIAINLLNDFFFENASTMIA